jgi:hypothetical protein
MDGDCNGWIKKTRSIQNDILFVSNKTFVL